MRSFRGCLALFVLLALFSPSAPAEGFRFLNGGEPLGPNVRPEVSVTRSGTDGYLIAYADGARLRVRSESYDETAPTDLTLDPVLRGFSVEALSWLPSQRAVPSLLVVGTDSGNNQVVVVAVVQSDATGGQVLAVTDVRPFEYGIPESVHIHASAGGSVLAASWRDGELVVTCLDRTGVTLAGFEVEGVPDDGSAAVDTVVRVGEDGWIVISAIRSGDTEPPSWLLSRINLNDLSAYHLETASSALERIVVIVDGIPFALLHEGSHSVFFSSTPGWVSLD